MTRCQLVILVHMPSKSEWRKAFGKLKRGQSYSDVADWLGVSKSGLYERHEKYLAERVQKQGRRLQETTDRKRKMEEKLQTIEKRYEEKEKEKERELDKILESKRKELKKVKKLTNELRREANARGLSLKKSLDRLKEIGDLEKKIEKLSNRVSELQRMVRKIKTEKKEIEDTLAHLDESWREKKQGTLQP